MGLIDRLLSSGADCPNGNSSQFGFGSAENCGYSTSCDHGTHVAGIAMGGPHESYPGGAAGIARGASLIPIQVFSETSPGQAGAFSSDLIAALNYVFNLPAVVRNNVSSVNMSLGGAVSNTPCDSDSMKPAIDNLLCGRNTRERNALPDPRAGDHRSRPHRSRSPSGGPHGTR